MGERLEVLMRVVVLIVTGIILGVWKFLVYLFILVNIIWTLISGKRIRELAELSEVWNTQVYVFTRYLLFLSNMRPFPFAPLAKSMSEFDKRARVKQ